MEIQSAWGGRRCPTRTASSYGSVQRTHKAALRADTGRGPGARGAYGPCVRPQARLAVISTVLLAVLSMVALPLAASARTARRAAAVAAAARPAGIPSGAPAAATLPEPALPEPSAGAWPFPDAFPRTSGTGRLGGGASFWSDFLYDDHGASAPTGFPLSPSAMVANLAPTQGIYGYPAGPADNNGADIFRSAVGLDATASYWRVDWTTLADKTVPIAEWTFDTDNNPATGASTWPGGAGVRSAGIDEALIVSGTGAWLVDPTNGATTDLLTRGGALTVDMQARSFIVKVPRAVLPVSGTWRIRLAAGLAHDGRTFGAPVVENDGLPLAALAGLPNVYNVTFRTVAQEAPVWTDSRTAALEAQLGAALHGTPLGLDGLSRFITGNFWNEDDQADTLNGGDVSKFSLALDWSQLAAKDATPEPQPTGQSERWYVTRLNLGQGVVTNSNPSGDLRPNYLSRVQPYSVYVPTGLPAGQKVPLTWILHSLGVNHNQYDALDPHLIQQLCQDRHSICASTLGFGPDGWYFDEAEVDFWQVWHALAAAYPLDTERTVVSGYSMGGWAAYKLGLSHPDLYAEALSLEGPPTCGIRVLEELNGQEIRQTAGSGRCADDGTSEPLLQNARSLPYVITQGVADELVPAPSNIQVAQTLDRLGYRYRFFLLPAEDHLVYATQDEFGPQALALGGTPARAVDPAHVTYAWFPDLTRTDLGIGTTTAYWLTGLTARSNAPGVIAKVDATSGGITDPAVTVQHDTTLFVNPVAQGEYALSWKAGARPAPQDALHITLTGVQSATVQLARAGLSCPSITAVSDGVSTLRLAGLSQGSTVLRGASLLATANASRIALVPLADGTTTLHVACASGTSVAPVSERLPGGRTMPPTGSLAATGLGVLPWVALVVAALAIAAMRRSGSRADRD